MPTFITVPRILTGPGCSNAVGEEAARLGRKALLVTGRSAMRAAGFTNRLIDTLRDANLEVATFEDVETEPTAQTIDRGRKRARAEGADVVICLGGGSVLDAGKAIAALSNEDAPTEQFVRGRKIAARGLRIVAVPTTAGTGSEVTPNSVITLPADRTKQSIRGEQLLPHTAVVDPELAVPLPPDLTAACGLDALTQAMESYLSIHATVMTEALSIKATILLVCNLELAWENGSNLFAREACSTASLMAGIALANARLGVVHGIAHPIGARYGVPHGLACAVLLPHALRLNREAAPEKIDMLDRIAGGEAAQFVEGLLDRFGMPRSFAPFGLCETDFDGIIQQSLPSGSLKANPKEVTADDVRAILHAVAG